MIVAEEGDVVGGAWRPVNGWRGTAIGTRAGCERLSIDRQMGNRANDDQGNEHGHYCTIGFHLQFLSFVGGVENFIGSLRRKIKIILSG